jgi:hypothetical protein
MIAWDLAAGLSKLVNGHYNREHAVQPPRGISREELGPFDFSFLVAVTFDSSHAESCLTVSLKLCSRPLARAKYPRNAPVMA